MLKKSLKAGKPVPINVFPLNKKTLLDFIVLITTLLVLATTFVVGVKRKFNYGYTGDRFLARLLGILYIIFIIICTGLAVNNAYF